MYHFFRFILDGRVTELVDHLHGEPGAGILARRQPSTIAIERAAEISGKGMIARNNFIHSTQRSSTLRNIVAAAGARPSSAPYARLSFSSCIPEVGPQDLLHQVLRRFRDLVVRREGHRLLGIGRVPAEIGDLLAASPTGDARWAVILLSVIVSDISSSSSLDRVHSRHCASPTGRARFAARGRRACCRCSRPAFDFGKVRNVSVGRSAAVDPATRTFRPKDRRRPIASGAAREVLSIR